MTLESPSAQETARQLFARCVPHSTDPSALGDALYRVYADASSSLRRAVGDDGSEAVLARALAHVASTHPVANDLRRTATSNIDAGQIAAAVAKHGEAATRAALEAILASVIGLLTRLVGESLATRLIDQGAGAHSRSTTDGEENDQ